MNRKEIKITYVVESDKKLKSNAEIRESLADMFFDDFLHDVGVSKGMVDIREFDIEVKDVM